MTKLDQIKAAAEAATEGPWEVTEDKDSWIITSGNQFLFYLSKVFWEDCEANAKFAALSRTAVPALCEAIEEHTNMTKMARSAFAKDCKIVELMAIIDNFDARIDKILEVVE